MVYKNLVCEVEETRKSVGEDVKLLEEEEEEVVSEENQDGEYQPTSELPDMMKQLTINTVKKLEEKLEVSVSRL